jgi:hypothetical protein
LKKVVIIYFFSAHLLTVVGRRSIFSGITRWKSLAVSPKLVKLSGAHASLRLPYVLPGISGRKGMDSYSEMKLLL